GSILGPAVIVVSFFELVVRDHSKDPPGGRAYVGGTRSLRSVVHHSAGLHYFPGRRVPPPPPPPMSRNAGSFCFRHFPGGARAQSAGRRESGPRVYTTRRRW